MHYLFRRSTLGVEAIGFQQSVQQLTDTMEKDGGRGGAPRLDRRSINTTSS